MSQLRSRQRMKPIQVGLLGIGTVGSGTFNVLQRNQEEIKRRAGRGIEITMVADLDTARAQARGRRRAPRSSSDARAVIANPEIDIVVELIGGYGIAKTLVLEAIAAGKHVVTANKALLAVHGTEIFAAAHEKGVMVAFEAAVAGGIPIIKALREGLTANRIEWIAGIINGTTNFILSEMRDKGLDFDDGAEGGAAPGLRRGRPDLRHRRRRRRAQGDDHERDRVRHPGAVRQGVRRRHHQAAGAPTSATPSNSATASSCWASRAARRREGIELRVHPTLVPAKRLIANVEGAMNAVVVQGDAVGTTLYYGKGAGAEPTAAAVIADLVDITRLHTADPEHRVPHLAFQPDALSDLADPADRRGRDPLLPAPARGRPGRRAGRDHRASWPSTASRSTLLQREAADAGEAQTDLIILTHDTRRRHDDAGDRADAGAADGAGADRAHPQGRAGVTCSTSAPAAHAATARRFCEILLEGLAPDGGLYLPERYPQVDAATLGALARPAVCRARLRDPVALHRRHPGRRPARAGREDLHRRGVRHARDRAAARRWSPASAS